MKKAVFCPTIHDYSDPRNLLRLAKTAETSGWDGLFIWDHMLLDPKGDIPIADATVALSAIAAVTEKLVIGPMITPISRRRPWKLAKELAALDRLSEGRFRLGVGLGGLDQEFANFGEEPNKKVLAKKTDEGLAIIDQLLQGKAVDFAGDAFTVTCTKLLPAGLQGRRVPVWIAAMLPFKAGLRRAARWDGLLAQKVPPDLTSDTTELDWRSMCLEPDELRAAVNEVMALRESDEPFDVIAYGTTIGLNDAAEKELLTAYRDAGATWWCEWLDSAPGVFDVMLRHVGEGPP